MRRILQSLDTGPTLGPGQRAALLDAVRAEFGDLAADDRPLGLLEACRLGAPYEVHIIDLTASWEHPHDGSPVATADGAPVAPAPGSTVLHGVRVTHIKGHEPMLPSFERARALALHPAYAWIEVYRFTLACVRADGSVTIT